MKNIYVGLLIIFGLYLLSLIKVNLNKSKHLKINTKLTEYNINMNLDINPEDILTQLDTIINEAFLEYTTLNVEFKELEYIDKDLETTICNEVSKNVIDKISPVFLDKYSLVFNRSTFGKQLTTRVYLLTLNYTIMKNGIVDKPEEKK